MRAYIFLKNINFVAELDNFFHRNKITIRNPYLFSGVYDTEKREYFTSPNYNTTHKQWLEEILNIGDADFYGFHTYDEIKIDYSDYDPVKNVFFIEDTESLKACMDFIIIPPKKNKLYESIHIHTKSRSLRFLEKGF